MRSHGVAALSRDIRRAGYYPAILFAILLGALLLRCWPRLLAPQVWAEDGILVLHDFIREGWGTFFRPVNGYWQLIDKLISALALRISFYHYPLLSGGLSCLFSVSVGLAVALSPTRLRGRSLCALALFLVPTDAEVFGLPLYAFWWAGVLLLLLALWDEKAPRPGWRIGFLLLGGLSSPLVLAILPVLYWRALRHRGIRIEQWLSLLATLVALLQISFMLAGDPVRHPAPAAMAQYVVPRFLGAFLVGNIGGSLWSLWLAGLVVVAGVCAWLRRDIANGERWVLLYLLMVAIALSAVRVDAAGLGGGAPSPRYLFYPFVLLMWIFVQSYAAYTHFLHRGLLVVIGAVAVANLLPVMTRFHVDLDWQAHVRSCRLFPEYRIPVEIDGVQVSPGWSIALPGADCDALLRRDSLVSMARLELLPTFPYAVRQADWRNPDRGVELLDSTLGDGNFPPAPRPGFRVVGVRGETGTAPGELRLRMQRGASLLYRSGPGKARQRIEIEGTDRRFLSAVPAADSWVQLIFANRQLPAEFIVRIRAADGEWSAIAVPE
jgi:hypothetical protein